MLAAILGFDWTMELGYMACAAAGGTVLVLQTLLMLFGFGDGGHDVDLHHDVGDAAAGAHDGEHADGFFGLISVRAVASFMTFFGLTGWMGTAKGWGGTTTILVAIGAGLALMVVVAWMMRMQSKLQSKGNLDSRNALGQSARVYLRIPGKNAGFGKVTLKLQGRTAELNAYTLGEELPTGALVEIKDLRTSDTCEVVALESTKNKENR
jgi:hypothetical protein